MSWKEEKHYKKIELPKCCANCKYNSEKVNYSACSKYHDTDRGKYSYCDDWRS